MSKKTVLQVVFTLLLFIGAVQAFSSSGEPMPWDSGLEQISKALTGRTIIIIGTLMFFGAGVTAMFVGSGVLQKILWTVAGLGIAINAPNLVTMLTGSAAAGFLF